MSLKTYTTKYLILKFPLLPTAYLNPFSAPGKQN